MKIVTRQIRHQKIHRTRADKAFQYFSTEANKENTNMSNKDIDLCIETMSGRLLNPAAPEPEDICPNDIAWALSRIPRFAGHTTSKIPYSVAQHSIHVSVLVEQHGLSTESPVITPHTCIKALFHDAHEAYFGDIPSPIKHMPGLAQHIKELEAGLDRAIFASLDIEPMSEDEKRIIKYCDKLSQTIEGYHFMPSRGAEWDGPKATAQQLQDFLPPLGPADACVAFLNRYKSLIWRSKQ